MSEPWRYQLRVYLEGELAEAAYRGDHSSLVPLTTILTAHDATIVSQFKAFEDYCAEAEAQGVDAFPLYKWTKATVDDPAMRAKHLGAFAIRVADNELYDEAIAAGLERDLAPLVGGALVKRMTKHDTNPANNIPVPREYRS